MELELLDNRGEFGLDKGLANGFGDFGGDRVGVDRGLDFAREVAETIFDLGIGLDDISVKVVESLALRSDQGWGLANKEGEEAHGFGDEEHVVIGAEIAEVCDAAEEVFTEIRREEPGDLIEDGVGSVAHTICVR